MTIYDPAHVRVANAERSVAEGARPMRLLLWVWLASAIVLLLTPWIPVWLLLLDLIPFVTLTICAGPMLILASGGCGCGHPSCDVCWYRSRGFNK